MTSTDRTPTATTTALIVIMLERRERTARESYEEARNARDAYVCNGGELHTEDHRRLVLDHNRASARWTEAQEALSMARSIAA